MRLVRKVAVDVYSPGNDTDLRCDDRLLCMLCATSCLVLSNRFYVINS